MSLLSTLRTPLAAAALMISAGAAQAVITQYTSLTAWQSVVTLAGLDTFNSIANNNSIASPVVRATTGTVYSYTASAGPASTFLYGAGSATDRWLSNDNASDFIRFSAITPGATAIGANFFGSNISGAFLAGGLMNVTVTEVGGATSTITLANATLTSFAGFVATGGISRIQVTTTFDPSLPTWSTVNDLRIAQAIPEPATYALMLAGVAAVGSLARRRRA